jgi:hypothetical protein
VTQPRNLKIYNAHSSALYNNSINGILGSLNYTNIKVGVKMNKRGHLPFVLYRCGKEKQKHIKVSQSYVKNDGQSARLQPMTTFLLL